MADHLELSLFAFEVMGLSAYIAVRLPVLLPALLALAVAHLALRALRRNEGTVRIMAYASALSERYASTGNMAHSIEGANRQVGDHALALLHRRYLLGDCSCDAARDGRASGLYQIIAFALRTGRKVSQGLAEFRKRAGREAEVANVMRSKTGAMRSVTYAGLAFFLPLFGGVTSNVLASLYYASGIATEQFLYSVLAYIALALFITSYAYEGQRSMPERIIGIMPVLSVSSSVLFLASTYISQAL